MSETGKNIAVARVRILVLLMWLSTDQSDEPKVDIKEPFFFFLRVNKMAL